jgi:hypothetical protein
MSNISEGKRLVFDELREGETLKETNDIKMAAALISFGIPLMSARHITNPRNNRVEVVFGFKATEVQRRAELAYLSKNLFIDASCVLEARDKLISYVSNGSRNILESMNAST